MEHDIIPLIQNNNKHKSETLCVKNIYTEIPNKFYNDYYQMI